MNLISVIVQGGYFNIIENVINRAVSNINTTIEEDRIFLIMVIILRARRLTNNGN